MIDLKEKLSRREQIREVELTQREIAKYLGKFPQQVQDATNGYQPGLWNKILIILGSQKTINAIKRDRDK